MTPEQKIKATIMLGCVSFARAIDSEHSLNITPENVEELWSVYLEDGQDEITGWCSQDEIEEFRSGKRETKIEAGRWSRHYECKEVAAKLFDGTWVGWPYWYGGGKHSEPQAIDWMCDAYEVDYSAEEKLVLVETFSRKTP